MAGGQAGIWIIQLTQVITILGGPAGYMCVAHGAQLPVSSRLTVSLISLVVNTIAGEIVEPIQRTALFGKLQGCIMLGVAIGLLCTSPPISGTSARHLCPRWLTPTFSGRHCGRHVRHRTTLRGGLLPLLYRECVRAVVDALHLGRVPHRLQEAQRWRSQGLLRAAQGPLAAEDSPWDWGGSKALRRLLPLLRRLPRRGGSCIILLVGGFPANTGVSLRRVMPLSSSRCTPPPPSASH